MLQYCNVLFSCLIQQHMKVIAMYFKTSYPPGAIFSTLYFLRSFQISWSVSLLEAGMACQGQTLEFYWALS